MSWILHGFCAHLCYNSRVDNTFPCIVRAFPGSGNFEYPLVAEIKQVEE